MQFITRIKSTIERKTGKLSFDFYFANMANPIEEQVESSMLIFFRCGELAISLALFSVRLVCKFGELNDAKVKRW